MTTNTYRMRKVAVTAAQKSQATAHPTAQWTMQQFREAIPADHPYRIVIHAWDAIFSAHVDQSVRNMGLRVLKTPVRTPVANAICERVIGTMRRECLDFMIPLSERYLSRVLKAWITHYNEGRPHMSLGPGIPSQPPVATLVTHRQHRRHLPPDCRVVAEPILGGLPHEYRLERSAA